MCGCENKQKGGGITESNKQDILDEKQLSKIDLEQIIETVDRMEDDDKDECSAQFNSMRKEHGEEGKESTACAVPYDEVCGVFGCHTDDTKCKIVKMCERTLSNQRRAGKQLDKKNEQKKMQIRQAKMDRLAQRAEQKEKYLAKYF